MEASSKIVKSYSCKVSDSFERTDEAHDYEPAFRRWLALEILDNRMTIAEALRRFNISPNNHQIIRKWVAQCSSEGVVTLGSMTEQEKQELAALQKKLKSMEKQLEEAKMRNIALNTLIDVAEQKLKIAIRKKPGARQ